jgi:apolipoprotein D and lipocalin family protein
MLRLLTIGVALLALVACVAGPSGRAKDAPPLEAVAQVDVARYMGLWYEIARYPTSFQKDCEGTTAEYTLRADGRVDVLNTCRFGTKSGAPRSANAVARVIDGSNGARIFVNFAPIPLLAGRGNYWILYLDPEYTHALIGEPSGRFLWMLSRTPAITPEVRGKLDAAAVAAGYDLSLLKETEQK